MTASPLEVVLTGLDADGRAVLAVLLERAVSDVAAFQTLASAQTFGQVRAHPAAVVPVQDWLDGYLEQLRDDGDEESTGADDEPFDAERFFGEDNWWVWRPYARQATVDLLDQHAEELAAELLEEDTLVRLNVPDNPPLVPPAARERLEKGLRALGFVVRPWELLAAWYDGSDVDRPQHGSGRGAPAGAREGGQ